MLEFRINDPYMETVRKMFQIQARHMALITEVIAAEKMVFVSVVCNHMHCKTMLVWMG